MLSEQKQKCGVVNSWEQFPAPIWAEGAQTSGIGEKQRNFPFATSKRGKALDTTELAQKIVKMAKIPENGEVDIKFHQISRENVKMCWPKPVEACEYFKHPKQTGSA